MNKISALLDAVLGTVKPAASEQWPDQPAAAVPSHSPEIAARAGSTAPAKSPVSKPVSVSTPRAPSHESFQRFLTQAQQEASAVRVTSRTPGPTLRYGTPEDMATVIAVLGLQIPSAADRATLDRNEAEVRATQSQREKFSFGEISKIWQRKKEAAGARIEEGEDLSDSEIQSREEIFQDALAKQGLYARKQHQLMLEIAPIVCRVVGQFTAACVELADRLDAAEQELSARFGPLYTPNRSAEFVRTLPRIAWNNAQPVLGVAGPRLRFDETGAAIAADGFTPSPGSWAYPSTLLAGIYTPSTTATPNSL